jgi:RND family efflux transporter MFP subunit
MNRRRATLVGVTLLGLICLPTLRPWLSSERIEQAQTVQVQSRVLTPGREFEGRLVARETAGLGAGAFGRVLAVHVREGEDVQRGALLFELDDSQVQADLAAARSELHGSAAVVQRARAQRSQAQAHLQRGQRLAAQGWLGAADLTRLEVQATEADAELQLAQARAEQLRQSIGKLDAALAQTRGYAPIDGRVLKVSIKPGEFVAPVGGYEQGDLVRLADMSTLEAELEVPEAEIARLEAGDPIDLQLPALLDADLPGRVRELGAEPLQPAMGHSGRTGVRYPVRVALTRPTAGLRPGMSLRGSWHEDSAPALSLPLSAVQTSSEDPGLGHAWIVEDGRVHRRALALGHSDADYVEVREPALLEAVFVAGPPALLRKLEDGMRVQAEPSTLPPSDAVAGLAGAPP